MRTFERTHPWISFQRIGLQHAAPKFWLMLGEAASKCDHIAGVPLRPGTADMLHRLYLAKGALATTAIEGNTLSESEVLQRLEGKLKLPPSREYLGTEVDNVINACNDISKRLAVEGDNALTVERIKQFNEKILSGIKVEEGCRPGNFRTYSVTVGNVYRGAPPEDIEYLMRTFCEWLSGPEFKPEEGMETIYALIKAIIAHVYLAWIHPFGDGNGRTARLVEFMILLSAGVPTPAAHLLSNHYNLTRTEYYRQLDRASQTENGLVEFLNYAIGGFVDGLKEQLDLIRDQHFDVVWRNYVHEEFRDEDGVAQKRQRNLVLDLSAHRDPVAIADILELTPRLAKAYAGKTSKTLQRDIESLEEMGLVVKQRKTVRAKKEIILAFLPWRKRQEPDLFDLC